MSLIKKKEIYGIVDFEARYVSLIVTIYQNSQFHIIFNESIALKLEKKTQNFKNLIKQGKILAELIKKAEKETKIKLKRISFNLKIEKLKIIPHEYFYKFPEPTLFTQEILNEINKKFLKDYQKEKEYQNFLFKINKYILLDQRKVFTKPPLQQRISSIKINGFLYQVGWKQLYNHLEIFKIAKVKNFQSILLPYAMHINLLFSEKTENSVLILWNEERIQLFAFEKKIFTKHAVINQGLEKIINKISKKLHTDPQDISKYFYNLFNLDENNKIEKKINLLIELQSEQLKKIRKVVFEKTNNFLQKTLNEITFIIQEKFMLKGDNTTAFIFGDITQVGGIREYLKKSDKEIIWKINKNHFIGLKNYQDSFLIGNAYYQHLQKKILTNNNQN